MARAIVAAMEAAKNPPILRARGLVKTYGTPGREVRALDGIDLDIAAGECLVLLGPSGSGKSTLLNLLGGLDRPTSGEIWFEGRDLTRCDPHALSLYRRRSIGFVFQFFNLTSGLTARENVELITEIAERPMAADQALELVGLADRADHFPAELSGGQQQRVAIARAIAKRPRLIFCDEPTGSLDSASGIQVLAAIVQVAAETQATVVMVTHNAPIGGIADRVVRMRDGRITEVIENAQRQDPRELSW